ncbi:MAG: hypothetical protein NC548_52330 [Lachnospiraceae bacterium]|nr:hypothetical protein [Lachnospiraceae bacterium]
MKRKTRSIHTFRICTICIDAISAQNFSRQSRIPRQESRAKHRNSCARNMALQNASRAPKPSPPNPQDSPHQEIFPARKKHIRSCRCPRPSPPLSKKIVRRAHGIPQARKKAQMARQHRTFLPYKTFRKHAKLFATRRRFPIYFFPQIRFQVADIKRVSVRDVRENPIVQKFYEFQRRSERFIFKILAFFQNLFRKFRVRHFMRFEIFMTANLHQFFFVGKMSPNIIRTFFDCGTNGILSSRSFARHHRLVKRIAQFDKPLMLAVDDRNSERKTLFPNNQVVVFRQFNCLHFHSFNYSTSQKNFNKFFKNSIFYEKENFFKLKKEPN